MVSFRLNFGASVRVVCILLNISKYDIDNVLADCTGTFSAGSWTAARSPARYLFPFVVTVFYD